MSMPQSYLVISKVNNKLFMFSSKKIMILNTSVDYFNLLHFLLRNCFILNFCLITGARSTFFHVAP